jgi:hypothetical protein
MKSDFRKRCTGPRTPAGKRKASQNSCTHGLLSNILVITSAEEQTEFEELLTAVRSTIRPVSKMAAIEVQHLARLYWNRRRVEQMREKLMEALEAGDEQKMLEDFLAKSDVLHLAVPGSCDAKGSSKSKRDFLWHCENLVLRIGNDQQENAELVSQKQPYGVARNGETDRYAIEMHLSSKLKLLDRYHTMFSREIDRVLNRLRTIRELEKGRT